MDEILNCLKNNADSLFMVVKTGIETNDGKNVRVLKSDYFIENFCTAIQKLYSMKGGNPICQDIWDVFAEHEFHNINLKTDVIRSLGSNPYIKDQAKYIDLMQLVLRNQHGYMAMLRYSRRDLLDWIDRVLPKDMPSLASISTRTYWILTGLSEMPKCIRCGRQIDFKNIKNMNTSGYETCSPRCSTLVHLDRINKTKVVLYGDTWNTKKCVQTYIKRYGCRNPIQNPDVQCKRFGARYGYDGAFFDSQYEVAYYIWLKASGRRFLYQDPTRYFEYEYLGDVCRYFPDFYVLDTNEYVEIKGSQFFRDDGTMYLPYRGSKMSDEQYSKACGKYEAKRQCMSANGVRILTEKDPELAAALDFAADKFGKSNWHLDFRVRKTNGVNKLVPSEE